MLYSNPGAGPANGVFAAIVALGVEPRMLVLRSSNIDALWQLPGGKVDPEEDNEDALRRELAEELAIEVSIGPVRLVREERQHDAPVTLSYWPMLVEREFTPRLSDEHVSFEWVPQELAAERRFDSALSAPQLVAVFESLVAMTRAGLAGRVILDR